MNRRHRLSNEQQDATYLNLEQTVNITGTATNKMAQLSRIPRAALVLATLVGLGCDAASEASGVDINTSTGTGTGTDLSSGYKLATWGSNVTVTYANGRLRYVSNGIPNHSRDAQYAVAAGGGGGMGMGMQLPTAANSVALADFTLAQNYDFSIPVTPVKAASPTATNLGVIGVMISGASLFNPYEGDGSTVATQSNFSVVGTNGIRAYFLDACNGHPTPMGGTYHYHALPPCVTSQVDVANGPSHIIGVAFDGYPIYGNRDMQGNIITQSQLDGCNGITSPTPEFPPGVYHYVLLDIAGAASSIRCFSGVVDASLVRSAMTGMPSMPM